MKREYQGLQSFTGVNMRPMARGNGLRLESLPKECFQSHFSQRILALEPLFGLERCNGRSLAFQDFCNRARQGLALWALLEGFQEVLAKGIKVAVGLECLHHVLRCRHVYA